MDINSQHGEWVQNDGSGNTFFYGEDEEIGASSGANRTYSGYYYVSNVTYKYSYNNTDSFSDFSTVFTLERREWPTPEKVIVDENNE